MRDTINLFLSENGKGQDMKIHLFPSSDGIELLCSCGLEIDQQTKKKLFRQKM